jgi:putative acetyltransferase
MTSMPVVIAQEDPENADSVMLISELDAYLIPLYPDESCHGYSPKRLAKENIPFFILRLDNEPAACGAVKLINEGYGEIKRVYVRPKFRRKGLGKTIVKHLENYAAQKGAQLIRLESGINQPEALALYEEMKYTRIPAFPPYLEDPLSVFYEKKI